MWFSRGRNLGFIGIGMTTMNRFLGVKNDIHKKYSTYEQAIRDFNPSVGALTPPPDLFQSQTGATMAPDYGKNVVTPVHGKTVS